MPFEIIPVSLLSEAELKNASEFNKSRNLYNKYTMEELDDWTKIDLYEALDLDSYRDKAIPTDILLYCIKKKSATYHPTNNKGKQSAFFIIKRAETVLSNPKFRKVYDSCFLDESLPEDREYEKNDFFKTFSAVFEKNALFSEIKPVPSIDGDLEVFYKFWQNFKTNRVYDDPADIFDVSGSMRRFSADKNKEIMQQKKIKDLHRIQELVRLAIKRDPRIKKKNDDSPAWNEAELKSLKRFDGLFGKTANKFEVIAKKLNELFVTKRSPQEIKNKIEELKK